eukprot:CAMPEP_0175142058 /NCGR_PEP_ID=MMETSP0087-20121206/12533_1 /TAXON_ID=136419 /ORGANISM="Unknown Unknown, Strain D1" /LENGTH=243 /DNA_ID=CAMNT_0016425709 /DNA_START=29 /DNA_END=760 /DNA_ORIENTATION=+
MEEYDDMESHRQPESAFENFGRGSAAGRAIFNLYNNPAQQRKNYRPNVKVKVKKNPSDPHAEHLAKQKENHARVKYEKKHGKAGPGIKKARSDVLDEEPRGHQSYYPLGFGRKSEAQISHENRIYNPLPKNGAKHGSTVGITTTRADAIKHLQDRLEGVPQTYGTIDLRMKASSSSSSSIPSREVDPLEEEFVQVKEEIDERKQFLEEMRTLGQAGAYEKVIDGEIQQRVSRLRQLDQLMKSR